MYKFFILPVFVCGVLFGMQAVQAQSKIAYVDIATVMEQLPEAQDAQRQLDNYVDQWQKELDALEQDWQTKYEDYDKRKLILTDQGRANAERELQALDAQIMEYRDKKFGQDGELFTKEEELMRPIQNMVFEQVQQLAKEEGFDYVIDKSSNAAILYANDKYDLTKDLIKRIETLLPARSTSASQEFDGNSGSGTSNSSSNSNTVPSGSDAGTK